MNPYLPYPLRKHAVRVNWVNTYRIIWKIKDLFYRKARDYKEYSIHFIFQKRIFLIDLPHPIKMSKSSWLLKYQNVASRREKY